MLQNAYLDLISTRKKGLFATLMRGFLWLFSFAYSLAVFLRAKSVHPKYRPLARTISIGNIVAGGTGKTPFTIYLAEKIAKRKSVAVLLRGYKGQIEKIDKSLIVTKENQYSDQIGDEACLIARSLPEVKVIVGKNKCQSALLADQSETSVILIDDGMQHIALARDVEIVLLDSQNPFGYGYLLPRGLLREPISSLNRANLIVITSRNGACDTTHLKNEIREVCSAPIVTMSYEPCGLFDLDDQAVNVLPGTRLAAFCAIAKPEQFGSTLKGMGFEVISLTAFGDHDKIGPEALQKIAEKARSEGASCLVCTEKDRVKIDASLQPGLSLPIRWLKIRVKILEGAEHLDALG